MWRRTVRDRFFIALVVLATVTVLTLDFRTGVLDGVAGSTAEAFNVAQGGVRGFVRPIESVVTSVGDLANLQQENRRLRAENNQLRREVESFADTAREHSRLISQLQLADGMGLEVEFARVVGASLSGLERSASVSKGRVDGVVPNRAVLAPEGLVGRVSQAGQRSARVMLLTDAQSAVGVRIGASGETGLVRGTGGRNLHLELVSRAALDQDAVQPGDEVLTSGQGGIYPPGLLVGQVEEVNLAARGTAYTITVRPFVRFSQLDIVSVILSTTEVIEPVEVAPEAEEEEEEEGQEEDEE
jgi:rod shape-determining protein MreC